MARRLVIRTSDHLATMLQLRHNHSWNVWCRCTACSYCNSQFFNGTGAPAMPLSISEQCCEPDMYHMPSVDCDQSSKCFAGTFSYRPYGSAMKLYSGFWRGCVSRANTPQLFTSECTNCITSPLSIRCAVVSGRNSAKANERDAVRQRRQRIHARLRMQQR